MRVLKELRPIMEIESQTCFGSGEIEIHRFVDALASAADKCGLTLDWQANEEPVYVGWYGYGPSGSWAHCSDSDVARQLAKEIAPSLGAELALFTARCEYDDESGELNYEARTISRQGKVMPMQSTSLDDKNLEDITAGKIRDRLSQILDELTGCQTTPLISHSFRLFRKNSAAPQATEKSERLIARIVEEALMQLRNGVSATLARYDADSYEYEIQTKAGYPSSIYVSSAEMRAIELALSKETHSKIGRPTIHGPLAQ